jgi:hypothetical protein
MFIELTDHLRCPADHEEAYLVLLPDGLDGRSVRAGTLGCPVCGWATTVRDGLVDFGGGMPEEQPTQLTPEAIQAFLGLSGPGGYIALVGTAAGAADRLADLMPGVRIVAVNPPSAVVPDRPASVLRSGRWPIKSACLRGVALGGDRAAAPEQVLAAAQSVLPGLRIAVEGPRVDLPGFQLLAASETAWVAVRR